MQNQTFITVSGEGKTAEIETDMSLNDRVARAAARAFIKTHNVTVDASLKITVCDFWGCFTVTRFGMTYRDYSLSHYYPEWGD